ncbi:MAG: hypothetical protein WC563_15130 [Brevundimonas sp.]
MEEHYTNERIAALHEQIRTLMLEKKAEECNVATLRASLAAVKIRVDVLHVYQEGARQRFCQSCTDKDSCHACPIAEDGEGYGGSNG